MTDITVADLTQVNTNGTGVFDVLMQATKAHLEQEFSKSRIKGTEYSQVYLGSLQAVLNTSLEFLLQRDKINLEKQLLQQQVLIAQAEVQKANALVQVAEKEVEKIQLELEIMTLNKSKIPHEIDHLDAQTALVNQQKTNLTAEALNIPKQGALIDAQANVQTQQKLNLIAEALNIPKQGDLIDAQAAVQTQQKLNLISEELRIDAQTSLTNNQAANAVIEGTVLTAQKCKLDAEYDLIMLQRDRTTAETNLLTQKGVSERAQTSSVGVDADSVIGKQKGLYQAQTDGFARDAEQKATKIMVDSWNVRRTTDEGTVADGVNMLSDSAVGRAVNKMLSGVGA